MGRWSTSTLGKGAVAPIALLALALAVASADAAKHRSGPVLRSKDKVVVCHATGNGGYVRVDVAVDDIITGQGHGSHPNDIIPAFDYHLASGPSGSYPGQNWDATGQAIWNNGCVRPPPPAGRISVHVACVDKNADGTYNATFGYRNANTGAVSIPAGSANGFSPAPADRGQVTVFQPGLVQAAFTVSNITDAQLTWTVSYGGNTSSATADASFGTSCSGSPGVEPDVPIGVFVTCVVNHGSTYDAVFGYENDNPASQTVPVGDANNFSPGPADRGQPTVFPPGTVAEAVTVTGIPVSDDLTWTLAFADTRTAVASADFQVKCQGSPIPPTDQPVGIFTACVTNHGSTYDATFGYVNENSAEATVPIGPLNSVSPGPDDQGQPDTFEPGFVAAAFTVSGINASTAITWTVIVDGQVRTATATASFASQCVTGPTSPVDDAGISKSAAPQTVAVGQRVRFKLRVFNNGSRVLRQFEAKDTLAGDGLRVLSARSTLGRCRTRSLSRSSQVACSTHTLAPGQSMTIHVVAEAMSPGTWDDTATVPTTPPPPTPTSPSAPSPPSPPTRDRTPKDNVSSARVDVIRPAPPAFTG